MTPVLLLVTAAAGGLGATLRYVIDRALGRPPLGILLVNLTGSFALGVLTGWASALHPDAVTVLGVGLLGGYTTFSTAVWESLTLARDGRRPAALLHAVGTVVGCVLAAAAGLAAAGAVLG